MSTMDPLRRFLLARASNDPACGDLREALDPQDARIVDAFVRRILHDITDAAARTRALAVGLPDPGPTP